MVWKGADGHIVQPAAESLQKPASILRSGVFLMGWKGADGLIVPYLILTHAARRSRDGGMSREPPRPREAYREQEKRVRLPDSWIKYIYKSADISNGFEISPLSVSLADTLSNPFLAFSFSLSRLSFSFLFLLYDVTSDDFDG